MRPAAPGAPGAGTADDGESLRHDFNGDAEEPEHRRDGDEPAARNAGERGLPGGGCGSGGGERNAAIVSARIVIARSPGTVSTPRIGPVGNGGWWGRWDSNPHELTLGRF